ncbi:MAG: hypothetical protein ACRD2B_15915 [Terriglobia bacterium]
MISISRIAFVALFLVGASSLFPSGLWARHRESPSELDAKIDRQKNPVKKAKLEVRLGNVELQEAITAYDHRQNGQGAKLLRAFSSTMETSWSVLESTGRNAARKPQGFMELEIGLREDIRKLTDLRARVEYFSLGPINDSLNRLSRLHNQVLLALFPGATRPGRNGAAKAKMRASGLAAKAARP